jgi:hypothetical protein
MTQDIPKVRVVKFSKFGAFSLKNDQKIHDFATKTGKSVLTRDERQWFSNFEHFGE